jgi:hypothetical protein
MQKAIPGMAFFIDSVPVCTGKEAANALINLYQKQKAQSFD